MSLSNIILDQLIKFRHQLHQSPELSGSEEVTSNAIINFLKKNTSPTRVIPRIGGFGIAAVYDSGKTGPTVLLRSDMDALPIQESNSIEHRSRVKGVAHLCGHDGHTAILAGVANLLEAEPIAKGRAVFLFQPAEEIGQGAAAVIADPMFADIKPDFAFAMHNLPGFELGKVLLREGVFASASTGLIARIKGHSSHAAHPEDGNNPDSALAKMILGLNSIAGNQQLFNDFALLTVIHAKLGEVAFGTTPGNATLMATLRTYLDSDMKTLKNTVEELIGTVSKDNNLKTSIEYTEEFPATINAASCISIIKNGASSLNTPIQQLEVPFRWSEDFGHFSNICPSAIFGVGSGIKHPQLHNENYDFPDDIIEPTILLFRNILYQILG